ncbi:Pimeloyl-ACP methyl ester carboxylesterase [Actinacidiphila yanglinensis]|uniref:Pimeloyl-ACP methyl ester carboxylesterase n=1 Tax=Actinacidiphila yanglinensis TaxID=310779 RepID=A0A1H6CP21_9ACTN|nr:alpha/beta hydrolase [Actinacidiphila yanglinensis]SEG74691.1 Pimeloyl-ACP methyl ester carboxylesterase [Actinacidiphila yanglinensis]
MTGTTRTLRLSVERGDLDVTVTIDDHHHDHASPENPHDQHPPRVFLLLHGGGGPQTVAPFARQLADQRRCRVITPVHPGFGGTPRPDWLTDPGGLAEVHAALLDALDVRDVTVAGNSLGGWIAAEMAVLESDRTAGFVIVNGVGIRVPGHPVADTFSLTPVELSRLSFHDPAKFRFDPSALTDEQRAIAGANRAALEAYAGADMGDPTLRERLAKVTRPTLVVWGAGDQVVDEAYGRAFAEAVPGAEFRLLPGTGHLPQVETPDLFLPVLWEFAEGLS